MDWRFFFSFYGRMRRSHWWLTRLIVWALTFALLAFSGGLGLFSTETEDAAIAAILSSPVMLLYPVVAWIDIAACVKRLHDTGITGWAYLMNLIPFVGGVLSLVVMGCLDGTRGWNKFGDSAKYPELSRNAIVFE